MYGNSEFQRVKQILSASSDKIDWESLAATAFGEVFSRMSETMQNPEYHGEGDVFTHTKMVCEALIGMPEYRARDERTRFTLLLAALLHDIGKISCTVFRDGCFSSPRHSVVGATDARQFLWRRLGLCGDEEARRLRESVCMLVRYHSFPSYAMEARSPERRILQIASNGELARDFSIGLLCILERADVIGRISYNTREHLDRVEYCRLLADDIGCLYAPYRFASAFSRRAYFLGRTEWRDQELYDDHTCRVVMLSGLPGTGKDTLISKRYPELPMISLDDIRRRLGISPTENQSRVAAEAHAEARGYLRAHQPFVWNATCLTSRIRSKQISLFESYGASVETVFLETGWEEELRRNAARRHEVPINVIERMLSGLEIPERFECESVSWEIC